MQGLEPPKAKARNILMRLRGASVAFTLDGMTPQTARLSDFIVGSAGGARSPPRAGTVGDKEMTIYKSLGHAIQDLAATRHLLGGC
jgi:hypothetical protein